MLSQTLIWWSVVQVLSLITLPIALWLFRSLPGRGYAFSKPLALLLGGYVYWMALSLHLLPNRPGSVAWVFLLLAVVSAVICFGWLARREELRASVRQIAGYVLAVEFVFALTFFVAAYLRSFIPEIAGTEKPMDFMLLNAAARSQYYPPADPWLAGFDVSYYYFGYVINAMVGKLTFLRSSIIFNLGLASTAALAATAAFGLGYELSSLVKRVRFWTAVTVGGVALVLVTVMGNLVGAIEFGIANDYDVPSRVVRYIDIAGLDTAQESDACLLTLPGHCLEYPNERSSHWWWWRSTRISSDGNSITEFPFFSFLLGDLHPHVMAIPFVFTVLAAGLALYRSTGRLSWQTWRERPLLLLLLGVLAGGLGFLNTWDLPTFGFLLALLVLARNLIGRFDLKTVLQDTASFIAPLAVLAFVLYLPFYLSFSSQASGLDTVQDGATRPLHSFLLWGPLFAASLPLPLLVLWQDRPARDVRRLTYVAALPLCLLSFWAFSVVTGGDSLADAVTARGWNWLTPLFLCAALIGCLSALWRAVEASADPAGDADSEADEPPSLLTQPALIPVLAITSTALLLVLGSELFYVRDVFQSRLNTMFKLSYQAWLLLGVSGAFSLFWLYSYWRPAPIRGFNLTRGVWAGSVGLLIGAALLYPLSATLSRSEELKRPMRSLDGLASERRLNAEDWAVYDWLRRRAGPNERIVEATGGQYSSSARIAAWTGLPTVIGWLGHEIQWGRSPADVAGREQDVDKAYTTDSLGEALSILQKYRVTYVVVGSVERAKYPASGLQKFSGLQESFRAGQTALYRVPPGLEEPAVSR